MLKTASALLLECVKPVHGTCSPPQLAALLVGTWARRPSLFCYCYNCTRFQNTFHLLGAVAWGGALCAAGENLAMVADLQPLKACPTRPRPRRGEGG
jgi:hypothetical protein